MRKPDRRKRPGGPVVHTDGFPGDIPHFDEERANVRFRHYLKLCGRKRGPGYFRPSNGWACEGAQTVFRRTKHGRRVYPGGLTGRAAVGRFALLFCLLSLCVLFSGSAYGAISATAVWDVRTTGADTNGGGFDASVASPGTNFSLQNSPGVAYTDLTIGATTSTYTSTLNPVGTTIPGNMLQIVSTVSGTCTAGVYEVLSQAAAVATVDRALGTSGSVCHANLGGSYASIGQANSVFVSGNEIYAKAGTYTLTSSISVGANIGSWFLAGYTATHGDASSPVTTVTTATNAVVLIKQASTALTGGLIQNIAFTTTAGTPTFGIEASAGVWLGLHVINSSFSGFSDAIYGDYNVVFSFGQLQLINVEIKSSTSHAIVNTFPAALVGCFIHDNTGDGWHTGADAQTGQGETGGMLIYRSAIVRNAIGVNDANGAQHLSWQVLDSVVAFNSSHGISTDNWNNGQTGAATGTPSVMANTILYGNGGYGFNSTNPMYLDIALTNAFGSNTSGSYHDVTSPGYYGIADISLSANPFVDGTAVSGHNNFALNSTSGGGAALKAAGWPGTALFGTGYSDVGALQSQAATGVTAVGYVQ
jgi:hypothetical protein